MNNKEALRRLRIWKPVTKTDFKEAGLRLDYLGAGCFRETYTICGTSLVVKLPIEDYGKRHTNQEVKRIKKLSRYRDLKPYMPKVLYHDKKHGIVVMPYYFEEETDGFRILAMRLLKRLTGVSLKDSGGNNTLVNGHGHMIFVDLGY